MQALQALKVPLDNTTNILPAPDSPTTVVVVPTSPPRPGAACVPEEIETHGGDGDGDDAQGPAVAPATKILLADDSADANFGHPIGAANVRPV